MWTEQEWATKIMQTYWAQGTDDNQVHRHDMPGVRADVGMVVSYYEGSGKREREIGCVCEVHEGEQGTLLKSRLPRRSEKREALDVKSAGTQHRHPRGKSPHI
jgi:hypothetical protein